MNDYGSNVGNIKRVKNSMIENKIQEVLINKEIANFEKNHNKYDLINCGKILGADGHSKKFTKSQENKIINQVMKNNKLLKASSSMNKTTNNNGQKSKIEKHNIDVKDINQNNLHHSNGLNHPSSCCNNNPLMGNSKNYSSINLHEQQQQQKENLNKENFIISCNHSFQNKNEKIVPVQET